MIHFTIPVAPRTKKNSPQIYKRKNGGHFVAPSKAYKDYVSKAGWFIKSPAEPICVPVNVKAVFYMDTRRRVDLVNLLQALLDVLVEFDVLEDDNSRIVVSMDGSRVSYDKENPRTEVEITYISNFTSG